MAASSVEADHGVEDRRRLRILWVRHAPLLPGRTTRDAYLLPRIAREHDVGVVTWEDAEVVRRAVWRRLTFRKTEILGLPTWVLPKLPRPPGWRPWWPSINQPLFRTAMRWLERRLSPDVVVVGPCWTAMGYPPRTRAVRVFDYLDGGDWADAHWRHPDINYFNWSEAIIAVSDPLARVAAPWRRPTAVIPNGVELERLIGLRVRRDDIRARLGFDGRKVVSLVGLTAAPSLYWLDSVRFLARNVDGFVFVAAGVGPLSAPLEELARELPNSVKWLGRLTYEGALDLFVASDVTWYPAEDIPYFHNASPLKIFEGLAAGTDVVVAPALRSLAGLDLRSLHVANPTADDLAAATARALTAPARLSSDELGAGLASCSWDALADQTSAFLRRVVTELRPNGPERS
jgi:glycosyltransferase involved in cell wall biosynthesis